MSQSKISAIQKSTNGYDNDKNKADTSRPKTGVPTILAAIVLLIISVVTIPTPFQPVGKPTLMHVWYSRLDNSAKAEAWGSASGICSRN
jgi:hypothetical protein